MPATDPATIISLLISASHTLDHHQVFGIEYGFIALGNFFSHLQVGEHIFILSVQVLGGFVFLSSNRQNRCPVLDLFVAAICLYGGSKISDVTADLLYSRLMRYMNQRILIDFPYQIVQISLYIQAFQGSMESFHHAPEVFVFFHNMNLVALFCDGQGTSHTCDPAADHQGGFIYRQVEFLKRFETAGTCHRHSDNVQGFAGCIFLLLGMHPGAMLANIGHVQVILVQTRFFQGILEQRFQGPG